MTVFTEAGSPSPDVWRWLVPAISALLAAILTQLFAGWFSTWRDRMRFQHEMQQARLDRLHATQERRYDEIIDSIKSFEEAVQRVDDLTFQRAFSEAPNPSLELWTQALSNLDSKQAIVSIVASENVNQAAGDVRNAYLEAFKFEGENLLAQKDRFELKRDNFRKETKAMLENMVPE
jgi:hypothetical protein